MTNRLGMQVKFREGRYVLGQLAWEIPLDTSIEDLWATHLANNHQWPVPGSPLKGPTMVLVTQPP